MAATHTYPSTSISSILLLNIIAAIFLHKLRSRTFFGVHWYDGRLNSPSMHATRVCVCALCPFNRLWMYTLKFPYSFFEVVFRMNTFGYYETSSCSKCSLLICENMAWPDAGLAIRYPLTQYTLKNTELMHAHMNIVLLLCRLNVFFFSSLFHGSVSCVWIKRNMCSVKWLCVSGKFQVWWSITKTPPTSYKTLTVCGMLHVWSKVEIEKKIYDKQATQSHFFTLRLLPGGWLAGRSQVCHAANLMVCTFPDLHIRLLFIFSQPDRPVWCFGFCSWAPWWCGCRPESISSSFRLWLCPLGRDRQNSSF